MRKHFNNDLLLLPLALSLWQPAISGPQASVPLVSLVPKADAVVVAAIVQATVKNDTASVTLNVERALKGNLAPRTPVQASWTWRPAVPGWPMPPIPLRRGMFFLHKEAAGGWTVIPCTVGNIDFQKTFVFLPAGEKPDHFKAVPGAPVVDQVLLEAAWAKEVGVPPTGAIVDLVWEYRQSHSQALKQVFNHFSQSSSERLRALALQVMVSDGDIAALQLIEAEQGGLMRSNWADGVLDELRYHISNKEPAAVAVLGRLLTSRTAAPELQEAAAMSLARVHTREVLPHLAGLLDSTSVALRTYAVGGFSMFANNVPVGSHDPAPGSWRYRTDETIAHSSMDPKNASFWRTWWLINQADIQQGR